jgi:hypothetical protein
LALVVVGCGLGVAGTVLGTLVTTLGFAGVAVWASRFSLALWIELSRFLEISLGVGQTARQALWGSSGVTVVLVIALCVLASSAGLLVLARLRHTGEAPVFDLETAP